MPPLEAGNWWLFVQMTGVGVITDFDGGRRIAADNGTHTALAEADEGEVRREEAGNRYCIVLLLSLLSGPRQDVCRCIMAHVRTDGCPWTHRIGC